MGEFVVGRRCLENNLLLILPIDLRVLRLEEHQLVICHGAFEEIVGVIHWGSAVHSCPLNLQEQISCGHSNYFTDLDVERRT